MFEELLELIADPPPEWGILCPALMVILLIFLGHSVMGEPPRGDA